MYVLVSFWYIHALDLAGWPSEIAQHVSVAKKKRKKKKKDSGTQTQCQRVMHSLHLVLSLSLISFKTKAGRHTWHFHFRPTLEQWMLIPHPGYHHYPLSSSMPSFVFIDVLWNSCSLVKKRKRKRHLENNHFFPILIILEGLCTQLCWGNCNPLLSLYKA